MENRIPLPLFRINHKFDVLAADGPAADFFEAADNLLELIDEGSREKMKAGVTSEISENAFEINAKTVRAPVELFKVFVTWSGDEASCLFVPMETDYEKVHSKLGDLQKRLSLTNFELYEKKEHLSDVIQRSYELSGPYIEISETVALLPIFGDLSDEKLDAIQEEVFEKAYELKHDRVLIDFTGIGNIENDGIGKLKDMVSVFGQMGMPVVIIGIKPEHARMLKSFKGELGVEFERSARSAIKKYLIDNV